ncbi:MAG: tRNA (guanosine(37)-N1)-methyltransferase TrmD [Aquabacterium sp.]|jgi:tRNA (guanine37-N1)-methyltransferase|uniref:tRNA (guanosine(37)-N1)-methyltransferase TrmD n=1 Tax=Aquabacterium sp. TaxID=1872578 RepID=UPI001B616BC9|nr:tRNA (guanosine(37)-N1)-methyltransferase TrmD [Aquabacterium sp.]MBP7131323.1 tRNA (guanosine(37)-N1)-methyltransferase TrmD [Aquabacterium sp.]MBP9063651.1 tRNA (guanosine(37)-N1)-methyltransferase TrmD [Aquabacterium sp.]MDQ5926534.1 tRNA (guanine37-N1)-methyltransferase [Pseudomonadota bacterium]
MAVRFDVITLFPELFAPFQTVGVTRRAFETKAVDVCLWQLRDFAEGVYRRVDDRPFGGGPGMVMLVEPLVRCLSAIRADQQVAASPRLPVVLFSPAGKPLTQQRVQQLAEGPGAVLVCGRYEGIDQRFIDAHVDEEISLGDYVLSGGELPALTLIDAVTRLQPGVLHDAASHEQDSFSDGLLDCPHYSRPEVLDCPAEGNERSVDATVPSVLMSGHHAHIARWRREQQLRITAQRRPELIQAARARGELSKQDEHFLSQLTL